MLTTILKILFFSLSMLGYIFYIYRKTKIQIEFVPIIVISMLTVGLFIGGLLDVLVYSSGVLFFLGLILFVTENIDYLKKDVWKNLVQEYLTPGVIFILLLAIYYTFLFKEQRLIHYDNFSHWGLIVKSLLMNDALPNVADTTISFNSYPPGSALYIYYFCKIVGQSEGFALLGQMTILLSSLLTIFSTASFKITDFKNKRKIIWGRLILSILTIIMVIYLLDGPSSVHDLLVDNLLTLLGIAIFSIIHYYFESPRKISIPLIFLTSFITLIKNSGIFFAGLALLLYGINLLMKIWKNRGKGQYTIWDRIYLFLPCLVPYVTNKIWTYHVTTTFPTEKLGKHTMGMENYLATFNEKSSLEIKNITLNFFQTLWSEYVFELFLLLFILLGFTAFYYMLKKRIYKRIITISIVVIGIFILYSLGLWIMYLVSMPLGEAQYLAGFSRYMDTLINYLFGISFVVVTSVLIEIKLDSFFNESVIVLGLILLYLTVGGENSQDTQYVFRRQKIDRNSNQLAIAQVEESLDYLHPNPMLSVSGSNNYYIYIPDIDTIGYASYYIDYRLYQKNVKHVEQIKKPEELWEYDFLAITKVTDEIIDIFSKYSTEYPKIGTYEIDGINHRIGDKILSDNN